MFKSEYMVRGPGGGGKGCIPLQYRVLEEHLVVQSHGQIYIYHFFSRISFYYKYNILIYLMIHPQHINFKRLITYVLNFKK